LSREELEALPRRWKRDEEDEEDEGMEERIKKVAMMIANEGPGEVESGESDVDSDGAWEESGSDEERWGEVFRGIKNVKDKVKIMKDGVRKVCPDFTLCEH